MRRLNKRLYISATVLVCIINICCSKNKTATPDINIPEIKNIICYTNQLTIVCGEIQGAKKYEAQYSTGSNMSGAVTKETVLPDIEIGTLQKATEYYVQVRAYNGSEWTAWSQTKSCKTASFETTIETYNILGSIYDGRYPNNTWASRKEAVRDIILQPDNNPDIFGIQEGIALSQVQELSALLGSAYDSHISPREISARAIFWKPEKYSLVAFDDNIDVFDETVTGGEHQRHITYVRLREKATNQELLVFNIHPRAGSEVDTQRERGVMANVLSAKAKELSQAANNAPVVILGDFNNSPEAVIGGFSSVPMIFTSHGYTDTFHAAIHKTNDTYSTHDDITTGITSKDPKKRIDYIFIYPAEKIAVSDYNVIINFADNSSSILRKPIPSDHRPVKATVHVTY